jgi:predicted ATPase
MLIGNLLSVRQADDGPSAATLEPQTLAAGYLKALRRILSALAARGPLILVLEDIHWADSASVDAIVNLLPLVGELPVLLVAAGRPDREMTGMRLLTAAHHRLGTAVTEIPLQPLSEGESRELVAHLLVIESLPVTVRGFILARAEGNPFFVEEVIRMLIDRGAIVRDAANWRATQLIDGVEIPDTLQGLLLARIDRLPDEARRALRVASVIGRQFSVRVLEDVLERSASS